MKWLAGCQVADSFLCKLGAGHHLWIIIINHYKLVLSKNEMQGTGNAFQLTNHTF
jgi:hypothetical protein